MGDENQNKKFDPSVRRELKKQYMEEKRTGHNKKRIWKYLVAILILAGIAAGIWYLSQGNKNGPAGVAEVSDDEWIKGPSDAPATLIEYGDLQCPACAFYAPQVSQLTQDFPGDLRVVFRHFPLTQIHPFAFSAALAAEAAGQQGMLWEMVDLLYENQEDWVNAADKAEAFELYTQQLNLNLDKFREDFSNSVGENSIRADVQSGLAAGVSGTPTFFLNGEHIDNPRTYQEFKSLIQSAIEQNANQQ